MSKEYTVSISEDGSLVFLVNEETSSFAELGIATTKRASHVEPNNFFLRIAFHLLRRIFGDKGRMTEFTRRWPCLWRVNLRPVGGPILEDRWVNRQQAIDAEVEWLHANFI